VDEVRARFPWRQALGAAGAYLLVSIAYFTPAVLPHFGRSVIGSGRDPQLFVWSLAWWPHAVLHGQNPFVTHVLWAPLGSNLAWTTAVPGIAFPLTPVTLAAGPVAAYNTAAVLLPALAAWTAFLLCRHVTRSFWPSLAGGYLFGFSSFVVAQELGHLHMTSVFLVPLVALVILRSLEGELGAGGLVGRLGPLLALQLALSTEVAFTLVVCLAAGLILGAATVPAARRRILASLLPIAASGAVAAVLAGPLLYYAATDYPGVVTPTGSNQVDALTLAFPTGLTAAGGSLGTHFVPSVAHSTAEDGQYLGLALLAIVALFAATRWRRPGSRFLVLAFGLTAVATLGAELRVRGQDLIPLPWRLVRGLPLFDNVIPGRFSLYLSFVAALIAALWAASPGVSRALRIVLTTAAVVALAPALWRGFWHEHPPDPAFFAARLDRSCLQRGDNVLLLPPPSRNAGLIWQAKSDFRFRLADGGLNDDVPDALPHRATMLSVIDADVPAGGAKELLAAAYAQDVDAILVDSADGRPWTAALDPVLHGRRIGGMSLYRLDGAPCRQT